MEDSNHLKKEWLISIDEIIAKKYQIIQTAFRFATQAPKKTYERQLFEKSGNMFLHSVIFEDSIDNINVLYSLNAHKKFLRALKLRDDRIREMILSL